ncbi:hypothetical protein NE237_006523 [Protea cynaroides]|uniref:1-phosphatidylinositol-3-phosphate 5-kinase n=1 Tax=Protea cynaroides TaxID=273540 RepID=A0A9Q0QVL6_9MAGN|nr:hypothetical protein NE237_006523 [Protea cynaroides]
MKEDSGEHSLSPSSSEYCLDVSDIDSSSVSTIHITRTPRAGYSVQKEQMGSPRSELEDIETIDDCLVEQQKFDFENNCLLWLPPRALDEEDESENNFFVYDDEDEDEDDNVGESGAIFNRDKFPVIPHHLRAFVSQQLQGEGIQVGNDNAGEDWLEIVTSVAWQAANFVKQDTSKEGSMLPGDYLKVKCIVSGSPSESTLIKGVVCTKDIEDKRMTSEYKNPRLLLLGGALEYQRVPNPLASFDTLLQQKIDHLKMVVSKIEAHRPNVLLVEKSVSSYAQEYLLAKEISLVLNVKRPLLERIARCTGALIVSSIDNLPKAQLGHCENFHLESVSEEWNASNQPNNKSSKTLMFFEGCPRPLGCTVLLKGTCREQLKKVKHVLQHAVFAAYHLSLETPFLADEGASLPKMPLKSPIAIPERMDTADHATGEYFSATDNHESILVSFSSRCVPKGTVCECSQLLHIKFYGSFDKPLGRFLRDNLFDQSSFCRACNESPQAHVLCYTHQQGNLTVKVRTLPSLEPLPGAHDGKIWMWHRCLKCAHGDGVPPATRRVVMPDAAWRLSFGKFLERSFSNHATANRVASCGHSLQRDCLRYYGFGSMVALLCYSPIDILSVHLPPSVLQFNGHIQQRWVQKEAEELSEKKDSLYAEIFDVLQSIEKKSTYVGHEPTDMTEFHNRIMEMKDLLRKEKSEYDGLLQPSSIYDQHPGQASVDILEINRLRRCLVMDSFIWDCQLCSLDSLLRTKSSVSNSNFSIEEAATYAKLTYAKLSQWRNEFSSDNDENKLEMLEEPNFQPVLLREIKKLNIFNLSHFFISSASFLASGGVRLLLPQTGHKNIVVPVYDEEPTSVISYALISPDYEEWMAKQGELGRWSSNESNQEDASNLRGYNPRESHHFKISFEDESSATGKAKFSVTCYFAKEFDAFRKKCCPSEVDFIRSLSRCRRWNAQGRKSNAYFAKTLDERFIIKQVTKTELDSFEEFAPEYFNYLTDSLISGSSTCLAKVLGIYQVTIKHLKSRWEAKMNLMVMENLFFRRSISRVYDLKGSRSRYNPDTTGSNNVLLDMNLLEALDTKPIFLGRRTKRILEKAVWNDTSFLASVDVMDYSLLVGVDEERNELVLGIINFMRKYTWDKHLETWVKTWVKASGILGDQKNASPTVISPKQYKKRFRKAMSTYFSTVPDQWSP